MSDMGETDPSTQPVSESLGRHHAPLASPDAATPPDITQQLTALEDAGSKLYRNRVVTAAVYGGVLATGVWAAVDKRGSDLAFGHTMPYSELLQHAVNGVQDVLAVAGGVGLGASFATIAAVKLAALVSPRAQAVDSWSSREMSESRLHPRRSPLRRWLETFFAGRVPVMAAVGAGLAIFATAISSEVSNGPERPVETVMTEFVPGNAMVVNYPGAMPMVESDVSRALASGVIKIAAAKGISAGILDENLGQMKVGDQTLSDLSLGVSVAEEGPNRSPLAFGTDSSCGSMPVMIDKTAGVGVGEEVSLNGVTAHVVGEVEGISATNRVGVVMDQAAMAACIKKDPNAPVHSVVLGTDAETAQAILNEANSEGEIAVVITKEQYLQNSKAFWDSNVKPITGVLALFAGLFASAVSGSRVREGLIRNRREWASKLGNKNGEWPIRATEFLRVMKDGVLASVVGGATAMFATPIIVNTLESGFQAVVGVKELLVGAAVAIGGSVLGAVKSLIRPSRLIREEESIRG